MAALEQLLDAARRVESVEVEIPAGEDPLEGLEELIRRARREEEGEGGAALQRLEERIEAARELPEPKAYQTSAGDPLEVLQARMRGEYDDALTEGSEGGGRPEGSAPEPVRREAASGGGGRREQMGAALEASLRRRPLPGEVRAEVAARLAALTEGASAEEVRQLWDLVVFGDGGVGTAEQEG